MPLGPPRARPARAGPQPFFFLIILRIAEKHRTRDIQKDKLKYDPHYHFNYLISYIFYILNKNLSITVSAIWLVTEIFVIFSLKKIISKFFNNDFLTFFLLFLFYITFRSGSSGTAKFGIDTSLNNGTGGVLIQGGINKPIYFK